MTIEDLRDQDVVALVSGGLDSVTFTRWAADHGVRVHCLTADLGQPDEDDISDIEKRMIASGAASFRFVDARREIAEAGILLAMAGAAYEGGYLNTTGIARAVTTELALPVMKALGIDVLSHGATGRGNDQTRFQLYANMLDPSVRVYAPWRDPAFLERFPGRSEMIEFCEQQRIPIRATREKPYSTDANLLGLTHEAGRLEYLDTPARFITPGFGVHPKDAPDEPERVTVGFEHGLPVSVNGNTVDPVALIETLNNIGGRNGVGIGVHAVENRYVGIKSRGVYEQPGLEVLYRAWQFAWQLVLDRRSLELYRFLSNMVGRHIYEAAWFHPSTVAALDALRRLAGTINGTITVELYKGNVDFAAADCEPMLYSPEDASMEGVGSFDHTDAEGFLGVLGVSARALNRAGQIWPDALRLRPEDAD
ncbi:MAG: argininosuccinate synthase [Candidatus Dadabacteria bacterium]|nr:MAG: argininosuccinate synthase [Candidatus Dadabacteria bacterium]